MELKLRDYIAVHCTKDEWLPLAEKIVDRVNQEIHFEDYVNVNDPSVICMAKYAFADMMLEQRKDPGFKKQELGVE